MSVAEFFIEWREWGFRMAFYNAVFSWVHRHDDHVRTWQNGERCSGCEQCGIAHR
jgi:hypothetical protein